MHQSRSVLVDWPALGPSRLGRPVGVAQSRIERAEQRQHGEIDLGMAVMAGRIDQAGYPVPRHEDVATLQVTMQQDRARSRR